MTSTNPQRVERAGGHELAAYIAFLIAAVIAIEATRIAGNVSLVWPANALAAALLVRDGRPLRMRAMFALWCLGVLANVGFGADPPLMACALAAVNVFEIWLAVYLLQGLWRDGSPIVDLALAGRILLLAGICAPTLATLPGALLAHAFLDVPLFSAAATWWQSSVCGAALVGPVIYLYSREELGELWAPASRGLNIALSLLSLVVTPLAIRFIDHSFIVVAAPLVIAALRMGALGASLLAAVSGAELAAFWAVGMGPDLSGIQRTGHIVELPLLPMVLMLILPVAVGIAVSDRRRAIQAHRSSQRWMQQLLEQSPIGMFIMRLDGVWELTNAAMEKMLGYPADELLGKLNTELFVAEEFVAGRARVQQLVDGTRQAYSIERRFRCHDGEWIWTRCTTTLMRDTSGAPARFIVQVENLAVQRRIEQELAGERERLATTLRAIADAVLVTDAAGQVIYMNRAAEQLLGRNMGETIGRQLDEVLFVTSTGNEASQISIASLCAVREEGVRRESPGILHLSDGGTRYVQESASPLHDADGALNGIVVVLRDVRWEFEREQKLRRDAEQDQLTGLANRRALQERIAAVVTRCETGSTATLLLVDLDHFKRINDQAGHQAGDEMLRHVALALRRSARSSDLIGRLGGDEFAVLLDDCPETRARQIAEEILRNILAIRLTWDGAQYSVGASVGGASIGGKPFTADAETPRRWIAAADGACYAAKAVGRGQIRFASAA